MLVSLGLFLAVASPGQVTGLSAYANRDLGHLKPEELKAFVALEKSVISAKEPRDAWRVPEPRWIKPYAAGSVAWIYLKIYPGYNVPDVSFVRAYAFDRDWKLVKRHEFPTGYRLQFEKFKWLPSPWTTSDILRVKVTSVGPFMSVNGEPAKPAFHPEAGILEDYVFDEEGAHLVRIQDGAEKMLGNSYAGGIPMIGSNVTGRTMEVWKADLAAINPVRQLSCLIWLGGGHLNAKDWRKKGYARETVKDSQTYEALRQDPGVLSAVERLKADKNPLLRRQAIYTAARLKEPLEPVETPPGD